MHDPGTGSHPLYLSAADGIFIPQAVFVMHATLIDIADGLNTPVGVHGETGDIVIGIGAVKRIQHEKGVIPIDG